MRVRLSPPGLERGPAQRTGPPSPLKSAPRRKRPPRALAHLDAALARWRGEAYAEVAFEPWTVPEAVRLTELRSRAQERRAELALTAQGGAAVVAELEALVREESWRLLALALYDAGRQGDALAALRRAREVLANELGLDPGEGLNADSGMSGRTHRSPLRRRQDHPTSRHRGWPVLGEQGVCP